jgi:hypothetical protein
MLIRENITTIVPSKIRDLTWISKLSDKEWEITKARLTELIELLTKQGIKMAKKMEKELEQ